jgi:hypothetical protein
VKTALIIDAVELFYEAALDLTLRERFVIRSYPLLCNATNNWDSGHTIVNYMKGVSFQFPVLGDFGLNHVSENCNWTDWSCPL